MREAAADMISEIDRWLAAELYRLYILSQEQIADCLNAQLESEREGKPMLLQDVVLRRGYITRKRLAEVLETVPPEVHETQAAADAKADQAPPPAAEPAPAAGEKARLWDPATATPQIIEDFHLEEILFSTPEVTTYSATSISCEERTWVRLLNPAVAREHPARVAEFRRQSDLEREFSHPNLLKGIAGGESKGFHFQVTEHVDGMPIAKLLEHRVIFDLPRQIRVALQVGCALAYLHDKGLAHTLLHPENVLLFHDGRIKVSGLQHAQPIDLTRADELRVKVPARLPAREAASAELRGWGCLLFHLVTTDASVWKVAKGVSYVLEGLRTADIQHKNCPLVQRAIIGRMISEDPLRWFPQLGPLMKRMQIVHQPLKMLVQEAVAFLEPHEPKGRLKREIAAYFPELLDPDLAPGPRKAAPAPSPVEPAAESGSEKPAARPAAKLPGKRPRWRIGRTPLRRKLRAFRPSPIENAEKPEEEGDAEATAAIAGQSTVADPAGDEAGPADGEETGDARTPEIAGQSTVTEDEEGSEGEAGDSENVEAEAGGDQGEETGADESAEEESAGEEGDEDPAQAEEGAEEQGEESDGESAAAGEEPSEEEDDAPKRKPTSRPTSKPTSKPKSEAKAEEPLELLPEDPPSKENRAARPGLGGKLGRPFNRKLTRFPRGPRKFKR